MLYFFSWEAAEQGNSFVLVIKCMHCVPVHTLHCVQFQEQPDKENVDDDEDKKNPAYVPRKGAFYEHDLRTGEEDAPEEELK